MRSLLLACIALGAIGGTVVAPARAQVTLRVPGLVIDNGRDHRGGDWRRREEARRYEEMRRREAFRDHHGRGHDRGREWGGR